MSPRLGVALLALVVAIVGCDSTPRPSSPAGPGGTAPAVASDAPGPSSGPVASGGTAVATLAQTPACPLLFPAEVATALGVEIQDAQELPPGGGPGWLSDCLYWRFAAHERAPLELTIGAGGSLLERLATIRGQGTVTSVGGLGDDAFVRMLPLAGFDAPAGSIFVRIGDGVLGLTLGVVDMTSDGTLVFAGDAASQQRILIDLATIVVDRLTKPPVVSAKTCELLSAAAAGALVGMTFASAEDVDDHDVWGPSCRYLDAGGPNANEQWIDLWVAVSSAPAAIDHFDACRASGAIVPGLGDDAFTTRPGEPACGVKIGFNFQSSPLVVRSGASVIAVGDWGGRPIDGPDRPGKLIAVARALLAALGGVSVTPPPVSADALVHPCELLTASEVGGIVGATITEPAEWSADASGNNAQCYYGTSSSSVTPLTVTLGRGTAALSEFNGNVKRDPNFTPVTGLGDEAFQRGTVNETDQPLLAVVVRSGDLVVTIQFGPVRQSADFLSYVAPGTPAQQLDMARQLLALLMPRVAG